MVIRRFRDHVAGQNWFAVSIDVGIVVIGVFLGTQVNNWNQARIDSKRADDFRSRLATELDFDARQYALQAAYYRQAKTYGLSALADLEGQASLDDSDFVIAAYQLTQIDTTRAKTGVYEEMASAELTDRLGDSETQQRASDFYLTVEVAQRMIETTLPYRDLLRESMSYSIQEKIREQCGDRNVYYRGRLAGIRLVAPCRLRIEGAAAAAQVLRASSDLKPKMTRYIASLDEKIFNLDLAGRQAQAFRERLLDPSQAPPG